jgi:hypothetical protein
MNYYIYDFSIDFDFDKLIIGNKIINENISKYYIYYLDKIPKDLYIKLPSMRTIYNYENIKYKQIKLPIYPVYEETNKLIKFSKNLKKKIIEIIDTKKEFYDFIEKKDELKILKLKFNENLTIIKNIKNNSEIKGIINISHIWENNNSYGLSIFISKLIISPKINIDSIDFLDEIQIKKKEENLIDSNKNANIEKSSEIKPVFKLSPDLLLQTKNKLINRNKAV